MLKKIYSIGTMRFNRRSLLFLLVLCTFMICFSFWSRCVLNPEPAEMTGSQMAGLSGDDTFGDVRFVNRGAKNYNVPVNEMEVLSSSNVQEIECEINKEYSVQCKRDDNEVYMPFSFVQKYFEVYGEFKNIDGYEKFEFSHSYSEVHQPPDVILPDGAFMSFEHYNVEIRKRVKCITAIEGVPISTQWEPSGHYYPIQIAQFALSHYSKYLREGEPETVPLLDGSNSDLGAWLTGSSVKVDSVWNKVRASQVIEFQTPDSLSNPGLYMHLKQSVYALSMDLKIDTNGSISITLKNEGATFHVHYVFSNTLISCDGKNIYYGLGEDRQGEWIHFSRDADMDLLKGLSLKCSKYKKLNGLSLLGVTIRGHGVVDNVTLSSAVHMDHFFDAANWFVNHQDRRGGWPIMVTRKLISGVMELQPGWYSAMAQGHGISTLVRAYLKSHKPIYLRTAISALKLFDINSSQGGVKARFANSYDWYEEYPTTPSSFVLNGFIFSLFGLYDLKQIAKDEPLETVTRLYNEGIKSLKAMLLMYDSGFGTFYDLRHISVGLAPNRARWDYHTVHISQLLQLTKMEDDPLFVRTVKRWQEYMHGVRTPHN